MSWLMILVGWLGIVTGNIFWIGHAIYQLVKTDAGFFTIVLSNFGFWLLHMVISIVLLLVGLARKAK